MSERWCPDCEKMHPGPNQYCGRCEAIYQAKKKIGEAFEAHARECQLCKANKSCDEAVRIIDDARKKYW